MNDTHWPLPSELYIEVTNRCNSRCQTCVRTFAELEPLRDLGLEEFRSLVDQVPTLQRVVLHGVGEPLLNRDLPALITHLKQRAAPPHVLFNSNALALTPQIQEALIEARLDEFRVSTDAAHRELYARIRGVDGFDKMVANVQAFSERIQYAGRGPQLSMWFTAMQQNLPDLPTLVSLAHRLGVSEVYVQRLVFYGQGLAVQGQSLYRDLRASEAALLQEAGSLASQLGVSFRASGASSPDESLNPSSNSSRPWAQCRRPHRSCISLPMVTFSPAASLPLLPATMQG